MQSRTKVAASFVAIGIVGLGVAWAGIASGESEVAGAAAANVRTFGPVHVALGGSKPVLNIGPLKFEAWCQVSDPSVNVGGVDFSTEVRHVAYSGQDSSDGNLTPKETGHASFFHWPVQGRSAPQMEDTTIYLPDGRGLFLKTALLGHTKPARDCTFFGWVEVIS